MHYIFLLLKNLFDYFDSHMISKKQIGFSIKKINYHG